MEDPTNNVAENNSTYGEKMDFFLGENSFPEQVNKSPLKEVDKMSRTEVDEELIKNFNAENFSQKVDRDREAKLLTRKEWFIKNPRQNS